jgi:hypothetical protein
MIPSRTLLLAVATAAATALPALSPATASVASMRPVAPYVHTPMTAEPLLLPPPPVQPFEQPPPEVLPALHKYTPVPAPPGARFRTPEAAMRFLARAYNAHDDAALKVVTTPETRDALADMHPTAPDLALLWCTFQQHRGDYECTFSHGFPASAHRSGRGRATFTVAPAAKPGWYMTVMESCG